MLKFEASVKSFPARCLAFQFCFWFTVLQVELSLFRLRSLNFPFWNFQGCITVDLSRFSFVVCGFVSAAPLFSVTTLIGYHIFTLLSTPFFNFFHFIFFLILFQENAMAKFQGGFHFIITPGCLSTSFYIFFNFFFIPQNHIFLQSSGNGTDSLKMYIMFTSLFILIKNTPNVNT